LKSTRQTKRLRGMRKKLMMVLRISSGTYPLRGRAGTGRKTGGMQRGREG
jgi:hypothetical protein